MGALTDRLLAEKDGVSNARQKRVHSLQVSPIEALSSLESGLILRQ
jgi:hypothetical protein